MALVTSVTRTWAISKKTVNKPIFAQTSFKFTGATVNLPLGELDEGIVATGTTSAVNPGQYTATLTPDRNHAWSDGTTAAMTVDWEVQTEAVAVPTVGGELIYTGASQSPQWIGYDASRMTLEVTPQTNAGTYTAKFTLKTGYAWEDGTTAAKTISWTIKKAAGSLSLDQTSFSLDTDHLTGTINVTRSGDGAISATSSNTSVATVSVSGTKITVTGKASGTATITVKVPEGTNHTAPANKTVSVTMTAYTKISTVPSQSGSLTYNAAAQSPTWNNYNSNQLTISGVTSGTNAGTYSATFTPKTGYRWSDGSATAKSVSWTIGVRSLTVPSQSDSLTYSGSSQSVSWNNYSSTYMTLGGTTSGTNAGSYTASFTLKSTANCKWSDNTTAAKSVSWSIAKATSWPMFPSTTLQSTNVTGTPPASGTLTYFRNVGDYVKIQMTGAPSGTTYSVAHTSYSTGDMEAYVEATVSGDVITFTRITPKTRAGEPTMGNETVQHYTITCTNTNITTTYTTRYDIYMDLPTKLAVPTQSGSLTYTGSAQSPSWSGYSSTTMTIGGTTSGTNAGSYTATFTLKDTGKYVWNDGTIAAKSVTWTIAKKTPSFSISPTSLSFTQTGSSAAKTITATTESNGTLSASSGNTSVASTSVSGKTITVTPKTLGSTNISVSLAAATNYLAVAAKNCAVSIIDPRGISAADFKSLLSKGTVQNAYSVGDSIGISLNGTVGRLTLNGTYYPQILEFNHNSGVEGTTGNYVDLQWATSANGTAIAFCDDKYGTYYTGAGVDFRMNTTDTSDGGYAGSQMTKSTCPAFLNLISSDWRALVVDARKYTDNTGRTSNAASCVTAGTYKIWLLAEFEIFGARSYANSAEQNYQKQYAMYANGGGKLRYRHDVLTTDIVWHQRSPEVEFGNAFCSVFLDGSASANIPDDSRGFAPGMRLAVA